jgi:hypothetical protein
MAFEEQRRRKEKLDNLNSNAGRQVRGTTKRESEEPESRSDVIKGMRRGRVGQQDDD